MLPYAVNTASIRRFFRLGAPTGALKAIRTHRPRAVRYNRADDIAQRAVVFGKEGEDWRRAHDGVIMRVLLD